MSERSLEPTRVVRATRVVLTLDLIFSVVAGGVLYGLSSTTDEHFAWSIKLPLTAAFLGAGYVGAVAVLVPSYRTADWARVRIIPVMGFTLTATTAAVTLWHLEQFHLGAGSAAARLAAWAWLAVYLAIPVLLAAVFVLQERAGGRREYTVVEPLLPLTRVVLVVQAVAATVLGLGLILQPAVFDAAWPWPLPPLSARAVAAWILTIAAGSWWGLREGDWRRFDRALPGLAVFLALVAVAAVRYPEPLDAAEWQDRAFFAALGLAGLVFALAAWQQRRRRRERGPTLLRPPTAFR